MKRLPEDMRHELKDPFGKLLKNEALDADILRGLLVPGALVITCGDETTKVVQRYGIKINMAIIDHKTKREEIKEWEGMKTACKRTISVKNPPAVISTELDGVIGSEVAKLIKNPEDSVMLVVDGEEDLAFIPCALHSPDGTAILYGQPNEGMVAALVDEDLRNRVSGIYERMETIDE